MRDMQVIAGAGHLNRSDRVALARSTLSGILLIVVGFMLGWAFLATPLLATFAPNGRPTLVETATGIAAFGLAIVLPAGFLMFGVARLASLFETATTMRPRTSVSKLGKALGPDHVAAAGLVLPGGRRIHEMVMGPFGILVIGAVPPPSASRHDGSRWEVRDDRGRWLPIESPVDRATRDAERVRSWLTEDDRDFLVRVYAAIVTDDERVQRSPACAVVAPRELGAWIAALPAQRGLTDERRERLAEMFRTLPPHG